MKLVNTVASLILWSKDNQHIGAYETCRKVFTHPIFTCSKLQSVGGSEGGIVHRSAGEKSPTAREVYKEILRHGIA